MKSRKNEKILAAGYVFPNMAFIYSVEQLFCKLCLCMNCPLNGDSCSYSFLGIDFINFEEFNKCQNK